MGSPLSPILANLFMEEFEQQVGLKLKHLEEVFEKSFPKKIVQKTIMHKRENTRDSGSIDEKTNLILPYIIYQRLQ